MTSNGKTSTVEKPSFDDVVKNLSDQKKSLRQKIYQSDYIFNIIQLKKEGATIQRKSNQDSPKFGKNLNSQAEELNNRSGPAKLSEISGKNFKKARSQQRHPAMSKLTTHFQKCCSTEL